MIYHVVSALVRSLRKLRIYDMTYMVFVISNDISYDISYISYDINHLIYHVVSALVRSLRKL